MLSHRSRLTSFAVQLVSLCLGAAACRSPAPPYEGDDLVGIWELEKVNGLGVCTIQSGDLEIVEDEDFVLGGELEWVGTCDDVGAVDDFAEVLEVIVDDPGALYQIDVMGTERSAVLRELDCVLDEPDLDCSELAGNVVVQLQFVRRE